MKLMLIKVVKDSLEIKISVQKNTIDLLDNEKKKLKNNVGDIEQHSKCKLAAQVYQKIRMKTQQSL